jgi:segregation and condensation protein B
MDEQQIKTILEGALLAAGRPLTLDKLAELFTNRDTEIDPEVLRAGLAALASDYEGRAIQLKEVASGYRIQVRASMQDWLQPLWEERAPRYTRALLETLALVAYRQPVTRAEIEEVRGVAVSSNIVRTLMERGWLRVVGYRNVPGKPSMLGTTREFLDYFGLKRLEDLPPLADIKDGYPELSPQSDFLDSLEAAEMGDLQIAIAGDDNELAHEPETAQAPVAAVHAALSHESAVDVDEDVGMSEQAELPQADEPLDEFAGSVPKDDAAGDAHEPESEPESELEEGAEPLEFRQSESS